jgi:DNA-binding NtrC family response regulator
MQRILVIEENSTSLEIHLSLLQAYGFQLFAATNLPEAEKILFNNPIEGIICEANQNLYPVLPLLNFIRENCYEVPVIGLATKISLDHAVSIMRQGAKDIFIKPYDPEKMVIRLREISKAYSRVPRNITSSRKLISSDNSKMQDVISLLPKLAQVDSTVLILGESGSGKEVIARNIHELSERSQNRFIALNCGAIPNELLESELFGHEQGSFTGADSTKIGIFEMASSGTIFLDEIGDMPLNLQVKLLRTLQEGEIKRVGGNRTINVTPRIIAATNRDVNEAIKSGTLREDLYYRLSVLEIELPPLRARPEDIAPLIEYYLEYYAERLNRTIPRLSSKVWAILQSYYWPGNVRELQNCIERALLLSDTLIEPHHLNLTCEWQVSPINDAIISLGQVAGVAARRAEETMITRALFEAHGNKTIAAKNLGVSYKTLLNKVKEYTV